LPWIDRTKEFSLGRLFDHPGWDLWGLQSRPKRVCVIGGGIAGLAAAYELHTMGHAVQLIEASDRLGGRIFTDRFKGTYGDLGAMRIPHSHFCTRQYLRDFGLTLRPFVQENLNTLVYLKPMERPIPRGDEAACLAAYGLDPNTSHRTYEKTANEVLSFLNPWLVFDRPHHDGATALYSKVSLWQFVQGWALPGPAPKLAEHGPLLSAKEWEFAGRLSGALWDENTSFLEGLVDYLVFNDLAMYEVVGGMDLLISEFEKRLDGLFLLGARATAVARDTGGINVTWLAGNGYNTGSFEYVVCAIPAAGILDIEFTPAIPQAQWAALSNINYGSAAKAAVHCKQRLWESRDHIFGGSSTTDLAVEQIWYPSDNAQPEAAQLEEDPADPHPGWGLRTVLGVQGLVDVSGPNRWTASDPKVSEGPGTLLAYMHGENARRFASREKTEQERLVRTSLEVLHPGLLIEKVTPMAWDVMPTPGGGAFAMFAPGEHDRYTEAIAEPLWVDSGERLFFAGEHVAGAHAWIQTSIQTALGAVWHILTGP
jgi:monoamine oxidase